MVKDILQPSLGQNSKDTETVYLATGEPQG